MPDTTQIVGIPTSIKASSGITVDVNGVYYKFNYEEERKLPDKCDVNNEIKALFDYCNQVVDQQVNEVRESYEPKFSAKK